MTPDSDPPWVVLGGGGLKGLAHVGVWRALLASGVRPAGVVGTSIGALVGALVASGRSAEELRVRSLELRREDIARVNRRAVWVNGIRQPSLFHADPLRDHIHALLGGAGWDDLRIPLAMNAVALSDGSTAWFGSGGRTDVPLADAIYASSALPVFYPPLRSGGEAFVDGGVGSTLALRKAAEQGARRIIGIDVGSGEKADPGAVIEGGIIAMHQRVVSVMAWRRRDQELRAWDGPPLLYVRPRLEGYGTFDFEHIEYFLDEGYRAMSEALEATVSR